MPPLGSRLRAILKTMQKTASRANEKLELLWAGETMRLKQRGHLEHGHHEHVHAGHAASPRLHDGAAPQRLHPFPAAFLSEVLPPRPGQRHPLCASLWGQVLLGANGGQRGENVRRALTQRPARALRGERRANPLSDTNSPAAATSNASASLFFFNPLLSTFKVPNF